MQFSLEALRAKHGDSLLLHYGDDDDPELIVIDGGPPGVYRDSLQPRLEQLREERAPGGSLPIRMVMVSHLDADHVEGILRMFKQLADLKDGQELLPYKIGTLWHNSFDDIVPKRADAVVRKVGRAAAAAFEPSFPADLHMHRSAAMVVASVKQGRDLRGYATTLGTTINEQFEDGDKNLVMVPKGEKSKDFRTKRGGLRLTVIGPDQERVDALEKEWDEEIERLGFAKAAEFVDKSVFNLSSIVVLATFKKKTMLLTGDARGDYVMEGLKRAGLLKQGKLHVDLLKIPHHGSAHNVAPEFFETVTADRYVVSGDGEYENPETEMFQMLSDARGKEEFEIFLTHLELPRSSEPKRLVEFFAAEKKKRKKYKVHFRPEQDLGIRIDLL